MIFNSVSYLTFLFAVFCLYWMAPSKYRPFLILVSSLLFYSSWRPEFLVILLLTAVMDFALAIFLNTARSSKFRFGLLVLSIGTNVGLLIYFKYYFFILDNVSFALEAFGADADYTIIRLMLPLGISFYTFESISYVVDVYRRIIRPEKSIVRYLCFITFFPKLIAGPIVRAGDLLPQLRSSSYAVENVTIGIRRILYGLFLKVVIADNIASMVDSGFSQSLDSLSALDVWTLAFLFGFQIYFDFSAYSSIAIGSALLLGIRLPENFRYPYLSCSPREFWSRWHVSLSSWIRDYLYLPLQGVRVRARDNSRAGISISSENHHQGRLVAAIALLITWVIMGMWHGASWTFLLWGLYHCVLIYAYRVLSRVGATLPNYLKIYGGFAVTLPAIMAGWIPFRADSIQTALSMWNILFTLENYTWLGMRENTYLVTAILLGLIILVSFKDSFCISLRRDWPRVYFISDVMLISCLAYLIFIFFGPGDQFIYFQF